MAEPMRVSVNDVRKKTHSGDAMLVCAYDDDTKCDHFHLEDSINLTQFKSESDHLDKSKEIFFFCA